MKGRYEMFGVVGSLLKGHPPLAHAHPARRIHLQVTRQLLFLISLYFEHRPGCGYFQQLPQLRGSTTRKSGSSKSLRQSQGYLLWLFEIQISGL